jgi:hypothetical protein
VVDTKGSVMCARALHKSHPLLRKSCEDAARKWRFKPFLVDGKPVSTQGTIVFHVKR